MSVSVTPASGTATYVCACFPNSLTASANAAWPSVRYPDGQWIAGTGALNGTIVSSTWNGTTGTLVVQPASGANVTITTNTSTAMQLLRTVEFDGPV